MARTVAVFPEDLQVDLPYGTRSEEPYTILPSSYSTTVTFATSGIHLLSGIHTTMHIGVQAEKEMNPENILFSEGQGRLFHDIIFFILSSLSIILQRSSDLARNIHFTKTIDLSEVDMEQDIVLITPDKPGKRVKYMTRYTGQWRPSKFISPLDD